MSVLIDYGKRVAAGDVNDPSFHLTLYEAPMEDDLMDPETWASLRTRRSTTSVRCPMCSGRPSKPTAMPSQENRFRNLILNQRVAAEAKFVELARWKARAMAKRTSPMVRRCSARSTLARPGTCRR
jgi:phage terminase large subunit-like protein